MKKSRSYVLGVRVLAVILMRGIEMPFSGFFSSRIEQFPIFNLKAVKDDKTSFLCRLRRFY